MAKILSYASGFRFQRLNANGSLDSSFHPPIADALPIAIAEQPDGRLILAGEFFPAPYGIDRIFPNGSRDNSFVVGIGLTNIENVAVDHAQILPNGKIIIGGEFNHIGLLPRNKIAVLNPNGSPRSELSASGLAPNNDRESAIIATLQTGAYTAVVRGSNGGTGIALVESTTSDKRRVPNSA